MDQKYPKIDPFVRTWKRRFLFFSVVAIFLGFIIELIGYGALIAFHGFDGRSLDTINSQLFLGRAFVSNPVEENTNVKYIGDFGSVATKIKWKVADPILGWRLGKNVGITYHIGRTEGLGWNITNPEGFAPAGELEFSVHRKKPIGDLSNYHFGRFNGRGVWGLKSA